MRRSSQAPAIPNMFIRNGASDTISAPSKEEMMEETMEEEDICRSDAADSAFSFIRREGAAAKCEG
ncbi:hypothetical protein K170097C1_45670 [Hungatella effluvii]